MNRSINKKKYDQLCAALDEHERRPEHEKIQPVKSQLDDENQEYLNDEVKAFFRT